MTKQWLQRMADAAEGAGGEEVELGNDGKPIVEGSGEGEGKEEPEKPAASPSLTPEAFKSVLEEVIEASKPVEKPAEKQYTQEEINKLLNVWEPSDELLGKLRSEDTKVAKAALAELRDGLMKQSNTMSEARFQQALKDVVEKEIAPLREFYSQQQAEAVSKSFYSKHKDLEPYELVVDAVTAKLEASGFKAKSQDAVFDEIAKNAREVLKQMNVKLQPAKKAATSKMATLSNGSQMGGNAGAPKRKPDMAIFDEVEQEA